MGLKLGLEGRQGLEGGHVRLYVRPALAYFLVRAYYLVRKLGFQDPEIPIGSGLRVSVGRVGSVGRGEQSHIVMMKGDGAQEETGAEGADG